MGPLNPELCPRCLDMFRSREYGSDHRRTLFDDDEMDDISPERCPVCAAINFSASNEGYTEIYHVDCSFVKEDDGREYCKLEYRIGDSEWILLSLEILPANGRLIASVAVKS